MRDVFVFCRDVVCVSVVAKKPSPTFCPARRLITGGNMDIVAATKNYEAWMRQCTPLVESDLRSKHRQMKDDPFLFFRGTFYRWAQLWPELCAELTKAPRV